MDANHIYVTEKPLYMSKELHAQEMAKVAQTKAVK